MRALYNTASLETNFEAKSVEAVASIHYEFAHFLRGIAAITVVLAWHFGGVFWINIAAVAQLLGIENPPPLIAPTWITSLHSSSFNFGHFGVALFFLISGFVIPFSCKNLKPRAFLTARFFRIYPTYWFGLTFSIIALKYLNTGNELLRSYNIGLQYLLVRDFAWIPSLDGISWTLEIELKFYLLCALINFTIIQAKVKNLFIVFFILGCISTLPAFLGSIQFIQPWLLPWQGVVNALSLSALLIIYMFIGTLFYWHCCDQIDKRMLSAAVMLAFIWFSIMWGFNPILKSVQFSGCFSYLMALFCFYMFYRYRDFIKTPRIFKWLANISFSLYIIHPIVGYALLYYFVYVKQISGFYPQH